MSSVNMGSGFAYCGFFGTDFTDFTVGLGGSLEDGGQLMPVFIDSPLGLEITKIYSSCC